MMISNRARSLGIALLTGCLGACAGKAPPHVSSLLIQQGEPSVSYDVGGATAPETPRKQTAGVRVEQSQRHRTESAETIESSDKGLGRALAALRASNSAVNHLRVAAEYRRLHILDEAFDHASLALKINARSVDALEQRAQVWREWGFPQLGLSDAYRAVFLAPRSASAHNTLGTLLQAARQLEPARAAYLQVVALAPTAAYGWSNLCYLSLVSGQVQRAIGECETALRIAPDLGAARNNSALAHATAGRFQKAHELLLENGNRAGAAFNVGMMYLALRNYRLAEHWFGIAGDLRPAFAAAQNRRRQAARLAAATSTAYEHTNRTYDNSNRP